MHPKPKTRGNSRDGLREVPRIAVKDLLHAASVYTLSTSISPHRLHLALARLNKSPTRCYELVSCLSLLGLLSLATCSTTPLLACSDLLLSGEPVISIAFLKPTPLILPIGGSF